MQESESLFNWPITVYYEDTDASGLVFHSNYINFIERARTELLRARGHSQQTLLEQNIAFTVRHIDIDYLKPAHLDDQLVVRTNIAQLKKASLTFCQEIVNPENITLCKAMVKVACISTETMKPLAIPHQIVQEIANRAV
ncbi:tol-pal system-associated acyl-CoA thioesterase [Vibrio profundum]|uniref:tol-pal system-associated acyl-CoA thioesterase n=1 Tax=Vibrio profundum TaxID=2910247 RepID=UPI003D145ABE